MNTEQIYSCRRPRHRVWCLSSEMNEGTTAGTYTFKDASLNTRLGEGSEIVVMDKPGMVLFWSKAGHIAYDWTAEEG